MIARLFYKLMRKGWLMLKFVSNGEFRSRMMVRYHHGDIVHQLNTRTKLDRYPVLFQTCQDYLGVDKQAKILSFGCSTGEEVFTLGRYFPNASIVGMDLNRRSLRIATKNFPNPKFSYIHSTDVLVTQSGPYDAIFCMAVLQQSGIEKSGVKNLTEFYPFEKFDQELAKLDKLLMPGGILTICNSNYRFQDASISNNYNVLPANRGADPVPKFDSASQPIQVENSTDFIFIKK